MISCLNKYIVVAPEAPPPSTAVFYCREGARRNHRRCETNCFTFDNRKLQRFAQAPSRLQTVPWRGGIVSTTAEDSTYQQNIHFVGIGNVDILATFCARPFAPIGAKEILKYLDFIISSNHAVVFFLMIPSPWLELFLISSLNAKNDRCFDSTNIYFEKKEILHKINKKSSKKTVRFNRVVNYILIDKNEDRRGTWKEDNWRFRARCNHISDKISFCFDPGHRARVLLCRLLYV